MTEEMEVFRAAEKVDMVETVFRSALAPCIHVDFCSGYGVIVSLLEVTSNSSTQLVDLIDTRLTKARKNGLKV